MSVLDLELEVLGRRFGCAGCARATRNGGNTLVLIPCIACLHDGRAAEFLGAVGGFVCTEKYYEAYCAQHRLPHLMLGLRSKESELTWGVYVPRWLHELLEIGQQVSKGLRPSERLDWPSVLRACALDEGFRTSLATTIQLSERSDAPNAVYEFVAARVPALVGVEPTPRKRSRLPGEKR